MKYDAFRRMEAGLLFLLALLLNSGGAALRTQEALAGKIIRLHVLAHSDAPADQSMKLQVRDRILQETAPLLAEARNREEAEAALRAHMPELSEAARDALAAGGCTYPVALELREAEFPTRCYGAFALPAGRYLTLRARIGAGAGHNWWCVAFPPLCGAVSVGDADESGKSALTDAADKQKSALADAADKQKSALADAADKQKSALADAAKTEADADSGNKKASAPTGADGGGESAMIAAAGFTADEISLITRKNAAYTVKFRVVERWESVRQWLTKSQCP